MQVAAKMGVITGAAGISQRLGAAEFLSVPGADNPCYAMPLTAH